MLPETTHDERAEQVFIRDLKVWMAETLDPPQQRIVAATAAEAERAGEGHRGTRARLLEQDVFRSWIGFRRISQEMLWDAIGSSVDRQIETLKARAQIEHPRGSVTLDESFVSPRYVGAIDIHMMPGGYDHDMGEGDIRQGAVIDRGGAVYMLGRNGGLMNDVRGHTIVQHLYELYPNVRPERILDLGCAVGASTVAVASYFPEAQVYGVDVGGAMLRYAHARAEHLGQRIHFVQDDAERTRFEDASFDVIYSAVLLHETSNAAVREIMRECHRLLRPGGVMIHSEVPVRTGELGAWGRVMGDYEALYNNEPFWRGVQGIDFDAVVRDAGFDEATIGYQLSTAQAGPRSERLLRQLFGRDAKLVHDLGAKIGATMATVAQDRPTAGIVAADTRLPTGLCLSFGIGSFGIAILLNVISAFFPALMTTVLGQSAALAGLLLTVSKLYDAGADIAIGVASDRTRSRWGRRRPYLLAGAAIAAASFLLIFMAPNLSGTALVLWMGFALIVYSTGYSLFAVPYMAMAGEMTDGYHERTRLLSFRAFFIMLGQLASSAGAAALIGWAGGGQRGYALMGAVAAALLFTAMTACFFGTAKARVIHSTGHDFDRAQAFRALATNKPFLLLMSVKICQYIGVAVTTTVNLLFILNVAHLGFSGLINLTLAQNVVSAICVPVWARISRKIGKRNAYLIATAVLALTQASWYFAGQVSYLDLWVRGAASGFASAGIILLSVAMLPDVMEYDRLRTGLRREGIFSGAYTIVEKISFAIGAAIGGVLLSSSGYLPTTRGQIVTQPASAIHALYIGVSLLPAFFMLLSFVLMTRYPLTEARLIAERQRAR